MTVNVLEYDTIERAPQRPAQVIGPLGEPLTLDSLPPPSTTRWVVRRKAEVVSAVNGGLLTVDEACERYSLSLEEFAGWQRAVDRSGMPGLRVTRIQHYKALYERHQNYCARCGFCRSRSGKGRPQRGGPFHCSSKVTVRLTLSVCSPGAISVAAS